MELQKQDNQGSELTTLPTSREEALTLWKLWPAKYYAKLEVRTYDEIFKSPSPQLSGLKKELGEPAVKALLSLMIVDVVRFFNVGKSMDSDQVMQTITLILEDYWILKPEDFKLCFNNAKKGQYGKIYDRIDGQIILEWLEQHTSGRHRHASTIAEREHDKYKKPAERMAESREREGQAVKETLHDMKVESYGKMVAERGPDITPAE